MDERLQFVRDALSDRFTMSELCARYGVSRRVGYKWLARYRGGGRRRAAGSQSRAAPLSAPHRADVAELLCAVRPPHPFWGARKLLARADARVIRGSPAGRRRARRRDLLARRGLVHKRRAGGDRHAPGRRAARSPRRRTISGRRTSKASSAPAMGCTAIRSPSPISTRGFCWPATACSRRRP